MVKTVKKEEKKVAPKVETPKDIDALGQKLVGVKTKKLSAGEIEGCDPIIKE